MEATHSGLPEGPPHYELIHFHSEYARVNQLCGSEREAFHLIHGDCHEFSQIHFPGLQTYPHFPVSLLLLLGFLQSVLKK